MPVLFCISRLFVWLVCVVLESGLFCTVSALLSRVRIFALILKIYFTQLEISISLLKGIGGSKLFM